MSPARTPDEEAIAASIRKGREERAAAERRRILGLIPPDGTPTADQIRRLAKADRKLAAATHPNDREVKHQERKAVLDSIEVHRAALTDQARKDEVLALAEARGEEVKIDGKKKGVQGRITLLGQDGLLSLFEKHAITARQKDAGLLFRAAYEGAQMRSTPSYGGAGGKGDANLAASTRAKHDIRRAACMVMCRTPRERTALVQIAGEGLTARRIAGSGNAHVLLVTALRAVLNRIADRYM